MILTKPKIGFAGAGWIGCSRMQSLANKEQAEIVAIADPVPENRARAAAIAMNARLAGDFNELLRDPEMDAIVIATPSARHAEQAIAAMENGKAVFLQKPIGRNAKEVRDVLEKAEKQNLLLHADFSYRHTAAFKEVLKTLRSGKLGRIFSVELVFHNAYGPDKPWFFDPELSGGGCLLDLGIHLIDLFLVAMDFPVVTEIHSALYAKGQPFVKNTCTEDFAEVFMKTEDHTSVKLSCSWNLHAGQDAVIEVAFYGTNGTVCMKNVHGSFFDFQAARYTGTKTEVLSIPPDNWGGRAIEHWLERFMQVKDFDPSAWKYLPSAEIIDRIYGK